MMEAWLLLGDFNTMFSVTDRIHGNLVSQAEAEDLQKCITDIGPSQLNRKGYQWSRCNKREAEDRIYNNINWAFGNSHWFMKYNNTEAL